MASFAILLFFAATGFTLNHQDWFTRQQRTVQSHGALDSHGTFVADEVLAKHDEKYMPPEVADALKKSGRWQEGGPAGKPVPLPAKAP